MGLSGCGVQVSVPIVEVGSFGGVGTIGELSVGVLVVSMTVFCAGSVG